MKRIKSWITRGVASARRALAARLRRLAAKIDAPVLGEGVSAAGVSAAGVSAGGASAGA